MEVSLAETHKRAYRHPKYKTTYLLENWPEYEKFLRNRGDITVRFSRDAIDMWRVNMKQKSYRDPVCGKKINRHKAQILIKHDEFGYFLCCRICQSEFEQNPDIYAKPEYAFKLPVSKKEKERRIR
jgi:YHS domain-containing protein